jgi:hypothetical protein
VCEQYPAARERLEEFLGGWDLGEEGTSHSLDGGPMFIYRLDSYRLKAQEILNNIVGGIRRGWRVGSSLHRIIVTIGAVAAIFLRLLHPFIKERDKPAHLFLIPGDLHLQ